MRRAVLALTLVIFGCYGSGCGIVKPLVDDTGAAIDQYWQEKGKAQAEVIAKDAVAAGVAGAEKAANEYTDKKAKELDDKTQKGVPWTATDWMVAAGLALAGGGTSYPFARKLRLWWGTKAEPVPDVKT